MSVIPGLSFGFCIRFPNVHKILLHFFPRQSLSYKAVVDASHMIFVFCSAAARKSYPICRCSMAIRDGMTVQSIGCSYLEMYLPVTTSKARMTLAAHITRHRWYLT